MFASQTEGELKVTRILKEKFPGATAIKVTDISGEVFLSFPPSLVGLGPLLGQRAGGWTEPTCHQRLLSTCGFWTDGIWPLPADGREVDVEALEGNGVWGYGPAGRTYGC